MRLREQGFIFYSLSDEETDKSSESKNRSIRDRSSSGLASDSIDSVNLYKYNRMI